MKLGVFFVLASMCVLAAGALGVVASSVSANPMPNPTPPPPSADSFVVTDLATGIPWLFAVNMFVNLLLISLFLLLLGWAYGARLYNLQKPGLRFVISVLALAVVVTLIGAFVDYYLVLDTEAGSGNEGRTIQFDSVRWIAAVIIIFISVVVPSLFIPGLHLKTSTVLGACVAAVNPPFWVLSHEFGSTLAYMLAILSAVLVPILLMLLRDSRQKMDQELVTSKLSGA